jgi:hypothetical protein
MSWITTHSFVTCLNKNGKFAIELGMLERAAWEDMFRYQGKGFLLLSL